MKIPGSRTINTIWEQINQHGIILMYHRVFDVPEQNDPWSLAVSPAHFEEHVKVLKELTQPVTLQEMAKSTKRAPNGKKKSVITFDDGYADNYRYARPILEKHKVPATFFVVSGTIDSPREFWWDELEQLVLAPDDLPEAFNLTLSDKTYQWTVTSAFERKNLRYDEGVFQIPENKTSISRIDLYFILWQILSHSSSEAKRDALDQIGLWKGCPVVARETHLPLRRQELQSMSASALCEIGAHTVSHPLLSALSLQEQSTEIGQGRADLETMIGKPVRSFSYPHGDHDEHTLSILGKMRFDCACTTVQKPVLKGADPMQLPRMVVLNWEAQEFKQNLKQWLK